MSVRQLGSTARGETEEGAARLKHASETALDQLEALLKQVRHLPGIVEKKRGIFYRGRVALLHFHEDRVGLFADVRLTDDWRRFRVSTQTERHMFLRELRKFLKG